MSRGVENPFLSFWEFLWILGGLTVGGCVVGGIGCYLYKLYTEYQRRMRDYRDRVWTEMTRVESPHAEIPHNFPPPPPPRPTLVRSPAMEIPPGKPPRSPALIYSHLLISTPPTSLSPSPPSPPISPPPSPPPTTSEIFKLVDWAKWRENEKLNAIEAAAAAAEGRDEEELEQIPTPTGYYPGNTNIASVQ